MDKKLMPMEVTTRFGKNAHKAIGNVLTVGAEVVGSTLRCQVDNGLTDPILFATEEDAAYFCTLQMAAPSGWDDFTKSVAQYAQVDNDRGNIYWSQTYTGSKKWYGYFKLCHYPYRFNRCNQRPNVGNQWRSWLSLWD
ncbi:hypothetical protein RCO48_04680 [Peribacillus frigoritolerans]|nr:hypothetical protein [Peribacillus frigoritolerans]